MCFSLDRRVLRTIFSAALCLFSLVPVYAQDPLSAPLAQQSKPAAPGGRVILILPFDNRSGNPSLNWIGDSFPDTLSKRLSSSGFLTISHDDRLFALDHLGLPPDFRPSRATTIRIAQQLDANFVIVGSYTVSNEHINIQAQVLSVDQLRLSAPIEDGADLNHLYDAENSIAWKIARAVDPQFSVAQATFLGVGSAVPLPAFENYIRGTTGLTQAERLKRLQASVSEAPTYAAALLALGKEQYAARDYPAAAATLSKVPVASPQVLEANFYLGLARFNSTQYAAAAEAFAFVAARLPLPEVINDQAVALSRQDKDATAYFQRASITDPNDEDYHYNLAVSLAHHGDTAAAAREITAALALKAGDTEAAQLRSALAALPPGSRLSNDPNSGFTAAERIRRSYSEASYRQAAFQIGQLRSARIATLPPAQAASEYTTQGYEDLGHGLLPEAEQQFSSAIAANPANAEAHAGLAQIRESSGDLKGARAEAALSLQLQPNVAALLVLSRLDLAANDLAASAGEVSQALKLEPQNSAALALRSSLAARGQAVAP